MNGTANTTGNWANWKYHVRGCARNVVRGGGQITFNLDPIWPHAVEMKIDTTAIAFLLLIGSRLSETAKGVVPEDDWFIILRSVKFTSSDSGNPRQDGDHVECYISESEAQRIRPQVTNPNLIVQLDAVYSC